MFLCSQTRHEGVCDTFIPVHFFDYFLAFTRTCFDIWLAPPNGYSSLEGGTIPEVDCNCAWTNHWQLAFLDNPGSSRLQSTSRNESLFCTKFCWHKKIFVRFCVHLGISMKQVTLRKKRSFRNGPDPLIYFFWADLYVENAALLWLVIQASVSKKILFVSGESTVYGHLWSNSKRTRLEGNT